jgi:hypothetical protein
MCVEFRSRVWVLDVESQGVLRRPVLKLETWALVKIRLTYHVVHGWKISLLHSSSGTQVDNPMTHHSGLLGRGFWAEPTL